MEANAAAQEVSPCSSEGRSLIARSHLDAVQAVAFGPEATVVSGSWDCTVKVWRLANDKSGNRYVHSFEHSVVAHSRRSDGLEPQITFRGHLAPVTSLAVSPGARKVFSGSLDSSIRVWNLPPAEHHTYSPHDPKLEDDTLVGHTDAVWALALLPSAADEPEGYLVSASSDGSVKVWSTTETAGYPLVSGWKYDGTADHVADQGEAETVPDEEHRPVPVAVAMYHPDLSLVLVGYDNGVIKLFEIKTGREVMQFDEGDSGKQSLRPENSADLFQAPRSSTLYVIQHCPWSSQP
jgi:striatin 1/3/4